MLHLLLADRLWFWEACGFLLRTTPHHHRRVFPSLALLKALFSWLMPAEPSLRPLEIAVRKKVGSQSATTGDEENLLLDSANKKAACEIGEE